MAHSSKTKRFIFGLLVCLVLQVLSLSVQSQTTYNLSNGSLPAAFCTTSWSVSGTTHRCTGGNGRVTLPAGVVLVADSATTIVANAGFELNNNSIGTSSARISLESRSGSVVAQGTNTINGDISTTSGAVTLYDTTLNGGITTTNGGGDVTVVGGTLAGPISAGGAVAMTGVTMTSGSVHGSAGVTFVNSQIGSPSQQVAVTTSYDAITVDGSVLYGSATAPNWSQVNLPNNGVVYGTCTPEGNPASGCRQIITPPPAACGPSDELKEGIFGAYYNYDAYSSSPPPFPSGAPAATRVDDTIAFDWSNTSGPGIGNVGDDKFAIRWDGLLRAETSGVYELRTRSDDGVRLYIGGQLLIDQWNDHSVREHTVSVTLSAGETYAIRMEFYEWTGFAVSQLLWHPPGQSFSIIPVGDSAGAAAGLYHCAEPPPPPLCPEGEEQVRGLRGLYYDLPSGTTPPSPLTGSYSGQRTDATVNFSWGAGGPNIGGVGTDYFAARWEGVVRAGESGTYRFYLESDDGVALWVNGERLSFEEQGSFWGFPIWTDVSHEDMWAPHSPTVYRSRQIELEAGEYYAIRMEYWEQAGTAVAHLRWDPPGAGQGISTIPAGPLPEPGPGLYHCSNTGPSYYTIEPSSTTGVTCEATPVQITARDAEGEPMKPPAGTEIVLSTVPATGQWVGGATHVFSGSDSGVIKPLRQLQPETLSLHMTDGTVTEAVAPTIEFFDAGLLFYNANTPNAIPTQTAGVAYSNARLRAVRKDTETGACIARAEGTHNVEMAYECDNPAACMSGPEFRIAGNALQANDLRPAPNAPLSYALVPLVFDADGYAALPNMVYEDVGKIQVHARLQLDEEGNHPPATLPGSTSFVVKPHHLKLETSTSTFTAGSNFKLQVSARSAGGNVTPNFGKETPASQANFLVNMQALVYPLNGDPGEFISGGNFSAIDDGEYESDGFRWSEVGDIELLVELDHGYLGAGPVEPATLELGRFYPHHFVITESDVAHVCAADDSVEAHFAYLGHPDSLRLTYTVQANAEGGSGPLKNFDSSLLADDNLNVFDTGFAARYSDGSPLDDEPCSVVPPLDGERCVVAPPSYEWNSGKAEIETLASVVRNDGREAPFSVEFGVDLQANGIGGGKLEQLDMDPFDAGDCTTDGPCTYKRVTGELDLRFGRLLLKDAFGPESANLPVEFATEYWDGSRYLPSLTDSCTTVPLDAITYAENVIGADDASRTVTIGSLSSRGEYEFSNLLADNAVSFVSGSAGHFFTPPDGEMEFKVAVDMSNLGWLIHDWNGDNDFANDGLLRGTIKFGSYRGHDRIIYWREVLQ